jgi:hypothetical protein
MRLQIKFGRNKDNHGRVMFEGDIALLTGTLYCTPNVMNPTQIPCWLAIPRLPVRSCSRPRRPLEFRLSQLRSDHLRQTGRDIPDGSLKQISPGSIPAIPGNSRWHTSGLHSFLAAVGLRDIRRPLPLSSKFLSQSRYASIFDQVA